MQDKTDNNVPKRMLIPMYIQRLFLSRQERDFLCVEKHVA